MAISPVTYIYVGTEEPLAGDAQTELNSSDFHPDIFNFQSPHQLVSATDQFMQSNSSNDADHSNDHEHVITDMEESIDRPPLPITTSQASVHSTKMSFSDDGTSDSFFHQDDLQSAAGDDQHPSPHQLASADQSIESSPQPIAGSCLDGHITNDIHVGTEEPLAGDAQTELNSSDFHPDIVNFQSPYQLVSAADQFMQSNSLKPTNNAGYSNEHVITDMDNFTASSSQCSSEPAADSEDGHTTPSHPMMTPNQHGYCAPEVGIIMEPRVHSSSRLSSYSDYGAGEMDKPLPGDVLLKMDFDYCDDKLSPLPGDASPKLNSDIDHNGNFHQHYLTITATARLTVVIL